MNNNWNKEKEEQLIKSTISGLRVDNLRKISGVPFTLTKSTIADERKEYMMMYNCMNPDEFSDSMDSSNVKRI